MQYGAQSSVSDPKGAGQPGDGKLAERPAPRLAFLARVPPALIVASASGVMAILLLAQVSPSGRAARTGDGPVSTTTSAAIDLEGGAPGPGDAGHLGDAGTGALDDAGDLAISAEPVWRVSSLAKDAKETGLELIDGTLQKRPLSVALGAAGIAKPEALRVMQAFATIRTFEDCGQKDTFLVARQKEGGKVVAFEYASSPFDVWQAKTSETTGELEGTKLELHAAKKRVAVALSVGSDLRTSIVGAGLDDDLLPMLDDALDGHAELADLHPGARLRILATEDEVDGAFVKYESLEAVEYIPATADAKPVRVYFFGKEPTSTWLARSAKQRDTSKAPSFYYDAKGRQPMQGGWKSPVPFARIASRFNPKRMHPVLHVVMPHNGVDFAATTGTPVYVAAEGTVKSVGGGGPCGNMVQVTHANNLTSAYCHLSRFASGLHAGQHLESRQLIGYVGATGRTTGPHLHFAVKRNDRFIDPLVLKLDGIRVVPVADRAEFERERAELDLSLDAIPLPPPPALVDAGPAVEVDAGADEIFEENP